MPPNQNEKEKSNGASPLPESVPPMSSRMGTSPLVGMGENNIANQMNLFNGLNHPQMQAAVQLLAAMQQGASSSQTTPSSISSSGGVLSAGQGGITNSNNTAMDSNLFTAASPLASFLSSGFFPSVQQPQQSMRNQNPLVMAALLQQLQQQFAMTQQSPPIASLESLLAACKYNPNIIHQGNHNTTATTTTTPVANHTTTTSSKNTSSNTFAAAQAFASLLQSQGPSQPLHSYSQQQQPNPQSSNAIPNVSTHSSELSDVKMHMADSTTATVTSSKSVPDTDSSEFTSSVSESQAAASSSTTKRKASPKKRLPKKVDVANRMSTMTTHPPPQQHLHHPLHLHTQYNPMTVQSMFPPTISNQTLSPLVMSQIQKKSLPELGTFLLCFYIYVCVCAMYTFQILTNFI